MHWRYDLKCIGRLKTYHEFIHAADISRCNRRWRSSPGEIGRGFKQGYILSRLVFSVYAEMMMIEAIEDVEEGVKAGWALLKDDKFADDQGMVALTEKRLQTIMDALSKTRKSINITIEG